MTQFHHHKTNCLIYFKSTSNVIDMECEFRHFLFEQDQYVCSRIVSLKLMLIFNTASELVNSFFNFSLFLMKNKFDTYLFSNRSSVMIQKSNISWAVNLIYDLTSLL